MKNTLIILGSLFILIAIGVVGYLTLRQHTTSPMQQGTTTFPQGGTTSGTTGVGAPSVEVITQTGTIHTADFIHNGVTIEDPSNKGNYYLAGSSGVCNPDGSCPKAGTNTDFEIVYWSKTGSFTISLDAEPLGRARQEAEQYLMQKLGIDEQQMCSLNYFIGTTAGINDTYAGENLGFSFCPNAAKLP